MGTRTLDDALRARSRESLERSRGRRRLASRIRRRRLRVRGGALSLAAVAICVAVAGAGFAIGSGTAALKRGARGPDVTRLQRRLGVQADGIFGPQTQRALRRFQVSHGLRADGVVGAATRRALGLGTVRAQSVGGGATSLAGGQAAPGKGGTVAPQILVSIAQCESKGDPRAVSPDGTYRGKYQFTRSMWRAMGGRGDPAAAPEWLQDRLALRLYRRSGTSPWPNCG